MPASASSAAPRGLALLGATGSIGTQALEVLRLFPERFRVRALTGNRNVELLAEQARAWRPDLVVVADPARYAELVAALAGTGCRAAAGPEALVEAATLADVDTVVAAIVGFAGLAPTLAAVEAGKTVALANKETLVVAGALVTGAARRAGVDLLPVDSEHSALFQCLVGEPPERVEKLILTASGGPFRAMPRPDLAGVTAAQALKHPNWDMGAKITIDSASLMNKGLEVIEARWLFEVEADRIEVVVHPQSIVHSLVQFVDGSAKAQLGAPDMRVPIQYALTYPDRWPAPHPRVDWQTLGTLEFEPPRTDDFPCLGLAYDALRTGGTAPAVLNAANETAVARFLRGELGFLGIPAAISAALGAHAASGEASLAALVEADGAARRSVAAFAG